MYKPKFLLIKTNCQKLHSGNTIKFYVKEVTWTLIITQCATVLTLHCTPISFYRSYILWYVPRPTFPICLILFLNSWTVLLEPTKKKTLYSKSKDMYRICIIHCWPCRLALFLDYMEPFEFEVGPYFRQ